MKLRLTLGEHSFGPESLIRVTYKQSVDAIYGRLPEGELLVELCTPLPLCPQIEEKLVLSCNGETVTTQWVKKCIRTGKNRYQLLAKPRTEFLQTKFHGNLYEEMPVWDMANHILGDQSGQLFMENAHFLTAKGYIPPCTRGQALEHLAFAIGITQCFNPGGELYFLDNLDVPVKELTADQLTTDMQVQMLPHYTKFELAAHSYTKGPHWETVVDRKLLPETPTILTFGSPYWDYNGEGTNLETGENTASCEIRDFGSNWAEVACSGLATVFGKPWLHTATYHTLPGVSSDDPWFAHALTVRDRTLIGGHNVDERLRQLRAVGQLRHQLTVGICCDNLVEVPQPGASLVLPGFEGVVTGVTITFTETGVHPTLTILCKER